MKKVRLFAVAAAMGMFASTVAAAEPVVTTGYQATWGEVDEIIKVDVGDKVVAPSTTIKVVKETRTTDSAEKGSKDEYGFALDPVCYTSTGVAEDENGDGYSDVQIYLNKDASTSSGFAYEYYTTKLEAVEDYLLDNHLVLAPGAEEVEATDADERVYYSKYSNETFANYEEVYAYFLEKGLIEEVYNEDGDLINVYVNATEVTDKKGNVLAYTRLNVEITGDEDDAKLALVTDLTNTTPVTGTPEYLLTYTNKKSKDNKLDFYATWEDTTGTDHNHEKIELGSVVIVREKKGELVIEEVFGPGAPVTGYTHAGWDDAAAVVEGEEDVVTIYETNKRSEVVKLATLDQETAAQYTPISEMVWDAEVGGFVKETAKYTKVTNEDAEIVKGYWYGNVYEAETDDEPETSVAPYAGKNARLAHEAFGIDAMPALPENPTDKYVLNVTSLVGTNVEEGKITLKTAADKNIVLDAVEIELVNGRERFLPAFESMEELVKVASKLKEFDGKTAINHEGDTVVTYGGWKTTLDNLKNDPWSGFTLAGISNELRGPGSEACYYVVEETSEEVEATITSDADSVDTSVAGVKTLTLTAKVGEEVVSTKEVKVVVAPKYERTYVNGKVSVLKAFHLNGNLYAEYHYDWAAKTYSATFYQQDGVTVGSTANGTL